jgi:hypothetical protein
MAPKKKASVKRISRSSKRVSKQDALDNICFTIMPYGEWQDYYYETIYTPAIKASGLTPRRADDVYRPSAITHDIWVLTRQAKIILADLSGKNPNVFYELGLGHALAKPAILVTDSKEDIPFDLRSLRVIVYDTNHPAWGQILQETIQTAIREVLASPQEAVLPSFLLEAGMRATKQQLSEPKSPGPEAVGVPRMSVNEALAFIRGSLESRPLAPDVFILSVLKGSGFADDLAKNLLESVKSAKKQPPGKTAGEASEPSKP